MTDHRITLSDHALARLRAHPGEPLLIVEAVEPPLPEGTTRLIEVRPTDFVKLDGWFRCFGTPAGEQMEVYRSWECRYRPGDVLVVETLSPVHDLYEEHRRVVERPDCKRVQDVTRGEWVVAGLTGFPDAGRSIVPDRCGELWWNERHASRPDLAWDRNPWVWLTWTRQEGMTDATERTRLHGRVAELEGQVAGAARLLAERRKEIERLQGELAIIKNGIREDDCWADDWCPVCHEHPSHDHSGAICPMREPTQAAGGKDG